MSGTRRTVGFGCPNETDPHHLVVDIPAGQTGDVVISEHYGIKAGINGRPDVAERCHLRRAAWSIIAEPAKQEFNERLKAKKLATSRWTVGPNKVERLLGKELLVLAWAVEQADPELMPNAVRNWIGLRPEERWWLYTMTAAATGGVDDGGIGWRKALQHALTENPLSEPLDSDNVAQRRIPPRRIQRNRADQNRLPGFDDEDSPFSNRSGTETFQTTEDDA